MSNYPYNKSDFYDYVIIGGGCAGLSLAHRMADSEELQGKKILLLERDVFKDNDRTWCFWTKDSSNLDQIISKRWKKVSLLANRSETTYELKNWDYCMIKGEDFYEYRYKHIESSKNVTIIRDKVIGIKLFCDSIEISTLNDVFLASFVFDSTAGKGWFETCLHGNQLLWQHFYGWKLKTKEAVFKENVAQMFDFRMPQEEDVRFMYLLPLSSNEALIEYTVFSEDVWSVSQYEEVLANYMKDTVGTDNYEIEEVEKGMIPMTDARWARRVNDRICFIGTKGGAVKPSTGYAFMRIQEDCDRIVKTLEKKKCIKSISSISSSRYWFYDALMLDVMKHHGGKVAGIFERMFKRNGINRMFKFLDEKTNFFEELLVMLSVPSMPFMQAIWHLLKRKMGLMKEEEKEMKVQKQKIDA